VSAYVHVCCERMLHEFAFCDVMCVCVAAYVHVCCERMLHVCICDVCVRVWLHVCTCVVSVCCTSLHFVMCVCVCV